MTINKRVKSIHLHYSEPMNDLIISLENNDFLLPEKPLQTRVSLQNFLSFARAAVKPMLLGVAFIALGMLLKAVSRIKF